MRRRFPAFSPTPHSLPAECVPIAQAHGRVLVADLAALRTQPPADVSAMDGYAVRAIDIVLIPARLKLVGEVAAGHPFQGTVGRGEAARIFTGGLLPEGSDTIVIQENTVREGNTVVVTVAAPRASTSAWKGWISSAARCFFARRIASATATLRWLRP